MFSFNEWASHYCYTDDKRARADYTPYREQLETLQGLVPSVKRIDLARRVECLRIFSVRERH